MYYENARFNDSVSLVSQNHNFLKPAFIFFCFNYIQDCYNKAGVSTTRRVPLPKKIAD